MSSATEITNYLKHRHIAITRCQVSLCNFMDVKWIELIQEYRGISHKFIILSTMNKNDKTFTVRSVCLDARNISDRLSEASTNARDKQAFTEIILHWLFKSINHKATYIIYIHPIIILPGVFSKKVLDIKGRRRKLEGGRDKMTGYVKGKSRISDAGFGCRFDERWQVTCFPIAIIT